MTRRAGTWQRGATLVELVVSIVVISVGLAGVLVVMERTTRTSGDPMVQYQAIAIAEAYLEEALLKEFNDPDGVGGETRVTFDDVNDYNGLTDNGAIDQNGQAIVGLEQYRVTMTVTAEAFNAVGPAPAVPVASARRVQVTVTPPFGSAIVMGAWRFDYAGP